MLAPVFSSPSFGKGLHCSCGYRRDGIAALVLAPDTLYFVERVQTSHGESVGREGNKEIDQQIMSWR
jgi:hypothetical protein